MCHHYDREQLTATAESSDAQEHEESSEADVPVADD